MMLKTIDCKSGNKAQQNKMTKAQLTTRTPRDYKKGYQNLVALHRGSNSRGLKPLLPAPSAGRGAKSLGTATNGGNSSFSTFTTDFDSSISSTSSSKVFVIDDDSKAPDSPAIQSTKQKSVHFGQVTIREYERIVGDNPAATSGPPLSLGWNYNKHEVVVDVEAYEATQEQQGTRRHGTELALDKEERCYLLQTVWGCTVREMRKAQSQAKEIRRSRVDSRATPSHVEKRQEMQENAFRSISRMFSKRKRVEEEKMWHDAYHCMLQSLTIQEEESD